VGREGIALQVESLGQQPGHLDVERGGEAVPGLLARDQDAGAGRDGWLSEVRTRPPNRWSGSTARSPRKASMARAAMSASRLVATARRANSCCPGELRS
jgi:hypothetical protein